MNTVHTKRPSNPDEGLGFEDQYDCCIASETCVGRTYFSGGGGIVTYKVQMWTVISYFDRIPALQMETKVGSLPLGPTTTNMPI